MSPGGCLSLVHFLIFSDKVNSKYVCCTCLAQFSENVTGTPLLEIKHGIFFILKKDFFKPPDYYLWCYRCEKIKRFSRIF